MTATRWIGAALLLAAAAGSSLAQTSQAQTWPSRQIEMIIAFPAGSGVDVIGRAMAAAIAQQAGQNIVVSTATAPPARSASPRLQPLLPTVTRSPSDPPLRSPTRPIW